MLAADKMGAYCHFRWSYAESMKVAIEMNAIQWTEVAIAATQALIAFSLVSLTFVIHRREVRLNKEWKAREDAWKNHEAELTREIHSNQVQLQRLLKVHEWGHECISTLSEADHLCLFSPKERNQLEFEKYRAELLRRLSALVDQGRMFFENDKSGDYGSSKLPAYQGLRPKVLDPLVAAYLAIKALDFPDSLPDESRNQQLIGWRRYFVSVLQKELNPEWIRKAAHYNTQLTGGGPGNRIDENSNAPSSI